MLLHRSSMNDFFREMNRLHDEMGRYFGRAGFGQVGVIPAMNVWEDDHNVYASADLPGVDSAKLDVSVTEGNQLTITGERPVTEIANAVWLRQERPTGEFTRVVTLPTMVDPNKVEAVYENGVLHITLPKADAAKPRKIAVKTV
jgi:HSP20 family protein